jgi:hypothetical protein
MEINSRGVAVDGRGREILVVETNLPGKYPVLGIQLLNSGESISKGGVRKYTKSGKYYANGKDVLDLVSFEEKDDPMSGLSEPVMVTLKSLSGVSAEVELDSEDYDDLISLGWSESDNE